MSDTNDSQPESLAGSATPDESARPAPSTGPDQTAGLHQAAGAAASTGATAFATPPAPHDVGDDRVSRRPPRASGIVWGLFFALVGVFSLSFAPRLSIAPVEPGVAITGFIILSGLVLLGVGIVSAARGRRHGHGNTR